jgi:hypothetical protein
MFVNYRFVNLCLFIFIITIVSSTASFCSNLTSSDDKDTACFLETPLSNPVVLRTSSNSLILPCHVARSKFSVVEWWYMDVQKSISIKIYPVFPAVRPTVLRFTTTLLLDSMNVNETDIIDASILLRHVNVDDSGIYRCIIRPLIIDPTMNNVQDIFYNEDSNIPTLSYQVQLTGSRHCESSFSTLPCFSRMRSSSPTIIDAYQTAFLQCVVNTFNRPTNVFWVVGNASTNNVLITDHLSTNQHNGDRLRRVFPLSPFDHSIELTINRDMYERVYSCVIDATNELETTHFTYIIHTINLEEIDENTQNETSTNVVENDEKIVANDSLNGEKIDLLRKNKKVQPTDEDLSEEDELLDFARREKSE